MIQTILLAAAMLLLFPVLFAIGRFLLRFAAAARGRRILRALCIIFFAAITGGTVFADFDCKYGGLSGEICNLEDAVVYENMAAVRYYVNNGADVNMKDDDGDTPLHWAAVHNKNANVILFLIEAGADVNAKEYDRGWTPLHIVARNDKKGRLADAVPALVKAGADVNAKSSGGSTPLHRAAYGRKFQIAEVLIKAGADIDAKNNNDKTPLDIAIREHGKDSKIAQVLRMPPLHQAVKDGNTTELQRLIDKGADVNAKNINGMTPLHLATYRGQTDILSALAKAGADLHARTDDGKTALDIAVEKHGEDSVIALFLQGLMEKQEEKEQQQAEEQREKNLQKAEELLREFE